MPTPDTSLRVHRRTVEEAIVQADAKERLRTARGVRAAGITLLVGGFGLLARASTWLPYNRALGVHIHGGPTFTLSFAALAGGVAIVSGPIVFATGEWLVRRATIAASSDPVTAAIIHEVEP